ncbi:dTDP-4-dehydrorhamnose reductase [Haloplanus vescus]|uniref:dTDP-4-dehydrorhamnose reductase n=1 Tax=Haloplanus vescus TaxID=555874 RepID=A0A1H3XGK9_9EURY|nr:dTDP-4-dehydrorhamnose reductase [Haloplanus vescus]SDZ98486.1 dTDP-4-dehydrorhamnose reductase [Haloplanus vescus]
MRVLVVGANGLLGSNVVEAGRRRGWIVHGTYHSSQPAFDIPLSQFSLETSDQFGDLLDEHAPNVVINCAAMTDVDACEQAPERAQAINGEAPGELADHCRASETEFVHISTDYVFDGEQRSPYDESDDPNPIQVYGESKLLGERNVRDEYPQALIPRLSFVWGVHRSSDNLTGFPAWVLDQLRAEESVPLFTDQWITPTRVGQAAEAILDLIAASESDRYHIACRSCITPYEFGEILADRIGASKSFLTEVSMDDVSRDAARPLDSCLAVDKIEDALGRSQPTLSADIDTVWDIWD